MPAASSSTASAAARSPGRGSRCIDACRSELSGVPPRVHPRRCRARPVATVALHEWRPAPSAWGRPSSPPRSPDVSAGDSTEAAQATRTRAAGSQREAPAMRRRKSYIAARELQDDGALASGLDSGRSRVRDRPAAGRAATFEQRRPRRARGSAYASSPRTRAVGAERDPAAGPDLARERPRATAELVGLDARFDVRPRPDPERAGPDHLAAQQAVDARRPREREQAR